MSFFEGLPDSVGDLEWGELAPRVAVKNHQDGDRNLRPDEIAEWQHVRQDFKLDEILALILTPNPLAGAPFHGYDMHWWKLTAHGVEQTEVELVIE